jgi:radical SAM superfamily enzyme YgiQ (UPF0313 family)
MIKSEYPNLKIIMGGYKSEILDGYGLVDATVMSYTSASEDIFLEYLDHLSKGTEPPIGQLVFPRKDSGGTAKPRMLYNTARNPRYNIEADDFRFSKEDGIIQGEPLPLDISRGCIFACRFCQYPHLGKGKLDYIRGMQYIEEEIRYNYENFGTTSYYILDDTFNDTEIKMRAFYDMTQRLPFKISYTSYLRADLIDRFPDTAHMIKESGCFGAYHGLESLHPEASKIVGKAWSGKHAREFIPKLYHDIWGGQVPQHLNFIVGITNDTIENVNSTVDWFKSNDLHSVHFDYLQLFGTDNVNSLYTIQSEFDKNAEKYGYTFIKTDQTGVTSWSNDNWTTDLAESVASQCNLAMKDHKRLHVWALPALEWFGFSKDMLRTIKSKEIPLGESYILDTTIKKQRQYANELLAR